MGCWCCLVKGRPGSVGCGIVIQFLILWLSVPLFQTVLAISCTVILTVRVLLVESINSSCCCCSIKRVSLSVPLFQTVLAISCTNVILTVRVLLVESINSSCCSIKRVSLSRLQQLIERVSLSGSNYNSFMLPH